MTFSSLLTSMTSMCGKGMLQAHSRLDLSLRSLRVHDVQRRVRQNNYRAGNAAQVVTFNRVTTLQCRTTVQPIIQPTG